MIHSLVKRLYEEKLYHVLPIHSSYNTYEEVEKDEYFLSFRSIILNVAVSRDLNVVVEETLNTIDNVLNGKPDIVSDNVTEDMMQSILVSIRLLSGTMEYYWNKIDKFCEQDKYDEKYKVSQDSKIGSTRVLKPIKVKEYPNLMTDSLAFRLLDTCTKIKFNGRTLQFSPTSKLTPNVGMTLFAKLTTSRLLSIMEIEEVSEKPIKSTLTESKTAVSEVTDEPFKFFNNRLKNLEDFFFDDESNDSFLNPCLIPFFCFSVSFSFSLSLSFSFSDSPDN